MRIHFLIFLLAGFGVCAQSNVKIKGFAKGYEGKAIHLMRYDDLITYSESLEAVDTVETDGFFEMEASTTETQLLILRIENNFGRFFVKPNFVYGLKFNLPDSNVYRSPNAETPVDISIVSDSAELNARIIDFNTQFDIFWEKNYKAFAGKKIYHQLDSFYIQSKKRYAHVHDEYFQTHVDYNFASLNINTGRHHNALGEAFLIKRPIRYHNFEYMEFFNAFYKNYLVEKVASKKGNDLLSAINNEANYDKINSIAKDDPFLKNDTLRELVLLKNFYEMYFSPDYSRNQLLSLIQFTQNNTKFKEHKIIASNMLRNLLFLKSGSTAPDFSYSDRNNYGGQLSDLRGKYTYLCFAESKGLSSLQEIKKLEQLRTKYVHQINFIVVFTDSDPNCVKEFIALNPKYSAQYVYAGNDESLKAKYNLHAFPWFYFVDPKGILIQSPAKKPSEGIEFLFKNLFEKKKRK
jgi:hypothetical protein